jgi:hypothetical protein
MNEDVFQILFLNVENQTVEAVETNCIEIDDLIIHLKACESVFINPKKGIHKDSPKLLDEKTEIVYFTHT